MGSEDPNEIELIPVQKMSLMDQDCFSPLLLRRILPEK
jgi:hypothetical protein